METLEQVQEVANVPPVEGDGAAGTPVPRVLAHAEMLVKVTGVLAAFGYMALRAHLNRLGIPATAALGVERYLAELWAVFASVLFPTSILLLAGLVGTGVLLALRGRLHRGSGGSERHPQIRWKPLWLPTSVAAHGRGGQSLRVALMSLSAVYLAGIPVVMFLTLLLWPETDLIVGPLQDRDFSQPDGRWWLSALLMLAVAGFASQHWLARNAAAKASAVDRWLGRLYLLAVVGFTLQLPFLYGAGVGSTEFAIGEVRLIEAGGAVCGLVVLETGSGLQLWRAVDGVGEVVAIPNARVLTTRVGELQDVLTLASFAGGNPHQPVPRCRP